jgi:glycerol-1-phosphate dehydrogenase [NAD(P)+]
VKTKTAIKLVLSTQANMTGDELLARAIRSASHTRKLQVGAGVRHAVANVFRELFGEAPAMVIADENTFAAAGRDVVNALTGAGQTYLDPLIFNPAGLYAEYSYFERIRDALAKTDAIPIAVGSGAINDLTKLAAHRFGRQYLCVATAASMDGYTAFGASITHEGSKQTFDCPAPLGVVADLEVIAAAPEGLNASGYADLVAKCPAGADWILADALGIDPIDRENWEMVQSRLRYWMAGPEGIRGRDPEALRRLTTALMITGFAMQAAQSSRPVSGAEHQFSHLWDMEHHTHEGITPSHGFKVGIGSLASLSLYEAVLDLNIDRLNILQAATTWPERADVEHEIAELFPAPELRRKALLESGEKYLDRGALRSQLELLKSQWPAIRERLSKQLIPSVEVQDMLAAAGCPVRPEQIGISRERLRISFRRALHIRRRFTILDLVWRTNLWDRALDRVFQSNGMFA